MIVGRQLDGAVVAEVGAVAAEGAGAEVEAAGDLLTALNGDGDGLDRAAGADALAHAAVDALFGVENDPPAVAGRGLAGYKGVHLAACLGKQAGNSFFQERKIHLFLPPFLFEDLGRQRQAVDDGLGPRRTAGHVHVNMDVFA